MRVGVVMPTFNQDKYLVAAVKSFYAQAGSVDAELVIVDDHCTDRTPEILASLEERVVRHEVNRGTAEAINTGVRELGAGYDALSWISSDNVMAPDWLSTLVAEIERGAGAAYGGFRYVFPPEKRRRPTYVFRQHEREGLLRDVNCYYGPAFLIRSDVWQPHGGRLAHDYDNWLRVEEACYERGLPIVGVDRSLCDYLAHDERATVTRREEFDAPSMQAAAKVRRGVA